MPLSENGDICVSLCAATWQSVFPGHNEIVRGTDSLIAGTVIFMKVLRDGICE